MAPLVIAGLSLLPKIPEMWDTIAGLFGKSVPKSITEATKLVTDITTAFKKGEVPPEIQIALEKEMNRHEEKIQEMLLEEKKLEFSNVHDMIELEKTQSQSEDEYVRRTRPMILRKLFVSCIGYAFYAPLVVIASGHLDPTITVTVVGMVEWIGGWLFGTFATAYLGYAASRTVDKKNPKYKNGNGVLNKTVSGLLKLG